MNYLVLDTNVLVSGMLSPHGPPARILDLLLDGVLALVADDRVFGEYAEVLARPRFQFESRHVRSILELLENRSRRITPPALAFQLVDPDDLPFLELAAAATVPLVTGNVRHFAPTAGRHGVKVLSPAEFIRWLALPT